MYWLSFGAFAISVAHAPPELCVSTPEVELSAASQYLASIVTQETACGSTDCPWVIRVPPGQTIEIALYDFAAVSRVPTGSDVCHVYAVIKEPVEQISHTVCAPTTREKVVHVSTTNVVEVRVMVNSNADEDYFALHYQGESGSRYRSGAMIYVVRLCNDIR